MDSSTQTTRKTAALKWTDYLLNDLDPSDEGWEMSMVLKELAKQYEAYDDQTPHPFGIGDGYNIRWKRYFVLVFQALLKTLLVLPQGTVALEQAIEMLERPAAPKQVGPVIIRGVPEIEHAADTANSNAANVNAGIVNVNSADLVRVDNAGNANNTTANNNNTTNRKKRPAEAMDQSDNNNNNNNNNNNYEALYPNKRVMTTHQNYPALPPGTIFKVDTQSAYKVSVTEGETPTFKFKSSGPARVQVRLNRGGVAASSGVAGGGVPGAVAMAATAAVAARGAHGARGAPSAPGSSAAPGLDVTNAPGTAAIRAPAPDPPTAPGTVVPAAPDPAPAVVAFATRASLATSGGVDNANSSATGWEGMGFGDMGFVEWSSVSSMSSNTGTDSNIA